MDCADEQLKKEIDNIKYLSFSSKDVEARNSAIDFINYLEKENLTSCRIYFQAKLSLAFNYTDQLEFVKAQQIYQEVILDKNAEKFYAEIARAHIETALVHEWVKNEVLCADNLRKAKEIIDKYDLKELLCHYHIRNSSRIRIFRSGGNAKLEALKAIKYSEISYDLNHVRDAYMLMGGFASTRDSSIYYTEKSLEIFIKNDEFVMAGAQAQSLANRYPLETDKKKKKEYLDLSRYYFSKAKNRSDDYIAYFPPLLKSYQDYYEFEGNIDSAYYYSNLRIPYLNKLNIYKDKTTVETNELNLALKLQAEELERSKKAKRFLQWIIGISSILLLTLLTLFIDNFKKRKKIDNQHKEIAGNIEDLKTLNKKNELLLTEVHHRVKNNLQNIIGLLYVQSNKSKNPEIRTTIEEVSNKINSIALIHDTLYNSDEYDEIEVSEYINKIIANTKNLKTYDVTFSLDIMEEKLSLETTLPIGIILTELITNSLKHNKNKKNLSIDIKLKKEKDMFIFRYADNGIGYSDEYDNDKGVGIELIKILSRQLYGNVEFSNSEGAVTSMRFKNKVVSKI